MKDLIEALTILAKYIPAGHHAEHTPTHCEHDELTVDVDPAKVSGEDLARLEELSFRPQYRDAHFISFRFGSC